MAWYTYRTENRGIKEIFIACVDGLTGFPDAINIVFPKTKIQLCIVHMIRNSVRYVSYKDLKAVTADLKLIYQSITTDEAESELDKFADKWDAKYPTISGIWRRN